MQMLCRSRQELRYLRNVLVEFVNVFSCSIDAEDVRLMLWDTAGQEEFDAITKAYYRGKMTDLIEARLLQMSCLL